MNEAWIREYWALIAASVVFFAVVFHLLHRALQGSRHGRLQQHLSGFIKARQELEKTVRDVGKARSRRERLEKRADSVVPRKLDEARDRHDDAQRLCEIHADKLKVAENLLRRHILEEYPPSKHGALLKRYGVAEHTDARPFTFDGGGSDERQR